MFANRARHRCLPVPALALLALCPVGAGTFSARASEYQRDTAPVTFQVTAPTTTPPGDPVYIAGDFQGWDPGAPAYQLTDLGGLLYEITLDLTVGGTIQFKFTRGTWGKVEKGPNGEEIANRTHAVTVAETLELTVANWADLPVSTITGDVTTHTVPGFLSGRRVWVYLPPGYHVRADQRYPVLYMLDGQNLFDQATSYAGEWEVDETCESLIPAGLMSPIIVVGVDNGGLSRIYEYTPWYDPGYGNGGGGEAHLQELITVLMPWVDANYRTLTGPRATGLAGSSLGGLMSLYAAYAHPEVFGLPGALSPSIWWNDDELLSYAGGQPKPASTVYMDMGTIESGSMVDEDGNGVDDYIDDLRAMRDIMVGQGFVLDEDLMVVEDEGGVHNEWHWAQRFPGTLQFLFPPPPETGVQTNATPGLAMLRPNAPNPFSDRTTLRFDLPDPVDVRLMVYDVAGRRVRELTTGRLPAGPHEVVWDGRDERGVRVASGIYLYRIHAGELVEQRRMVVLK
ncbi:MAG: alpha/beta hydrolase-fold protein [Candidatus Eisenbacteria bacterium]